MAVDNKTPINTYRDWQVEEGLPVYDGLHFKDLNNVELGPWKRRGGLGAYINLQGTGDCDDAYVCEIPAGESLQPDRHLFEELVFVLEGRGATSVWSESGAKQTFEWQEGSLFAIPLNASHQHFNGQGDKPARFMAVTNAPLVMNLFHSKNFIYNNPYVFSDRYQGQEGYFSGKGDWLWEGHWESNFIADVRQFQMCAGAGRRGAGGTHTGFELADNLMDAFISEFPVGTYKKAHRHGPGAHVIILSGHGFSLFWSEGREKIRVDWQAGSMFVPPQMWFHQHFNTGATPVRYMALKHSGTKYYISSAIFPKEISKDVKEEGGQQIEYEDEARDIHRMFEKDLAASGAQCRMKSMVEWCTA